MTAKKSTPRVPSYLRHKATGQAVTYLWIEGKRRHVYLGPHGCSESRRRFREIVAAYLVDDLEALERAARGQHHHAAPGITVQHLAAKFLRWAEGYYRGAGGEDTGELHNFVHSCQPLLDLYRDEPACDFGPVKLKRVREAMVESGLARTTTNARIRRIRQLFRWGVENELVPATLLESLRAVPGLRRGRTTAREPDKVRPVPEADVARTLPHLSRTVAAMVQVQLLTGMRPGELRVMTAQEIDQTGSVWLYTPTRHKNDYRGQTRTIAIGPRAQLILAPFLSGNPDDPVFSPAGAEHERNQQRRGRRRTPCWPSHLKRGKKPNPRLQPGTRYLKDSYRTAIRRACQTAQVPIWTPNQLRHLAATRIRQQFGIEAAQLVLGHATPDTTLIYAEASVEKTRQIAHRIG
ncbi:MAG: site-specific integrase [Planctomycetota bacterium]